MRPPTRALALLLLLPAFACGKRGDPRPPLRKTPPPLVQFRIAQRGSRLEVSGVAPRVSTDGVTLRAMTIELLRADGDGDFLKLARKRGFTVQAGETFTEPETLPPAGTLVRIAARAVASRQASALTAIMTLPAQPPPAAPANLEAALVEGGVQLKWSGRRPTPLPPPAPPPPTSPPPPLATPPATGPAPATGAQAPPSGTPAPTSAPATPAATAPASPDTLAAPVSRSGFWLYRRPQTGAYAGPLFPEPTPDKSHLDTEATAGQDWCYVVRAVVSSQPLIESDSSNEACLTARDVAPPTVPSGLTLLAQPEGLELRWSPSPEGDLRLYRVYRAAPTGTPERLAEVPAGTTVFLDRTAAPGTAYRYTITAVDGVGNESPPSAPLLGNLP